MYVAVTRAEKGLFLTESEGYNFAMRSDKYPSRFLREIKDGLVEIEGDLTKKQLNKLFQGTQELIDELEIEMNQPAFQIGDKVAHKYFGIGEIIDIVSGTSIKVRFNKGERNIQPNYVKYWDGTKTIEELFENNEK